MRIHLTGVGGAAMGNLAAMLKQSGHQVTGSDGKLYPPMSDRLREWKIPVREFNRSNLKGVDLLIVGNAISRGNVEVEEALKKRTQLTSMSAALYDFFLKDKKVIVVAGTHGKTTTTFLIDYILSKKYKSDLPGLFVGGIRADNHPGFRIPGKNPYFVIEGDEYDTAFFDKAAKFLHYRPTYLVLTSVEYDHADIYENGYMYEKAFRHLIRWIPENGLIAGCSDYDSIQRILSNVNYAPVRFYGSKKKKNINTLLYSRKGKTVSIGDLKSEAALIGKHNTANMAGAYLVTKEIGITDKQISQGFQDFPGVMRRQQIRFQSKQTVFIEDFAHHPTAVFQTIEAVKEAYSSRRLIALFEPRSASSHRDEFRDGYEQAFDIADEIYITDVFQKNKVKPEERLNVKKLVANIKKKLSRPVFYGKDADHLYSLLEKNYKPSRKGDVILAMSNGSFGGVYTRIEDLLQAKSEN